MAETTYTPPQAGTDNDSMIAALAVELRSRIVVAQALEERLKREGVQGDTLAARLREIWSACDALARRIAGLPPRTILDLEAKAAAFLWLDGGVSRGDEDPQARLVDDVMTFLAGGIADFLAPAYRDPPLDAPTLFARLEVDAIAARAGSLAGLLALHDLARSMRAAAADRGLLSTARDPGAEETLATLAGFADALGEAAAARMETTDPANAAEARARAIALFTREAARETRDCLERATKVAFRLGFDLPEG